MQHKEKKSVNFQEYRNMPTKQKENSNGCKSYRSVGTESSLKIFLVYCDVICPSLWIVFHVIKHLFGLFLMNKKSSY